MHDLMHDLASSVASNECLIVDIGETKHMPKTIRHLSVVCDSPKSETDVVDHLLSSPPSLRTLSFFHSIYLDRFQFPSTLRVLALSRRNIETLPPSICNLIHLRYLDLSRNHLVSLPESIHKLKNLLMLDLSDNERIEALLLSLCKLKCLRYLNLSYCSSFTSLPEGLGSMSSLRHLHNFWCDGLHKMPVGIGKLTCLETLRWFVVRSPSDGDNGGGGASISELQGLNQLIGELRINGLKNVRNGEDAKEANLSSKTHLTRLQLNCNRNPEVNNSKEVLEGLLWLPLNNITSLKILFYKAAYFPEVFLQNLKSLKSLEIGGCDRLKSLGFKGTQGDSNPNTSSSASSSSHFHSSSLQELHIDICPELLFSEEDFQNLEALCSLRLELLPQLTALPQGIQHLPVLGSLEIKHCWNLIIFPAWVKRREKDKGKEWHFSCNNPNIEFAPEDAKETEENNGENTIVELNGSATEAISDNSNG